MHLRVLHDLAHGGTSHINARCSLNKIEPSYLKIHLISLAILGIETKIRIGAELLAMLRKENDLILLEEKAENLRKQFQSICPDVSK